MNTNTQYVCFIRHKQASVNKWISKQMKKILLETLKITCEEVQVQQRIFKDITFSQVLLKNFAETFLTERSTRFSDTCPKLTAIFRKIVVIFLGKNTPNNKFLDVTNKLIKKVTWNCY